ncbi:hypothetical protein AMECASPLE_007951 [Ameca splendens]|uniref:Uncharacterized protein n=1 Tax=Ameca splendens TaxID=208324 RepID=A0ABV0XZU5_9TELE
MMDSCSEKSQIAINDGKTKDCNLKSQRMSENNKTNTEGRKILSHEKLVSQVKPNQQGLFQPPTTQQLTLPFSMSHRKPLGDIVVAVPGGMDMTVTAGYLKNDRLQPHPGGNGENGFSGVGNWSGQQLEAQDRAPQPSSSFLQPQLQPQSQTQPDPKPQAHLLSIESFLSKAPPITIRETNGNVDLRSQSNLNSLTANTGLLEKLCSSLGEKTAAQSVNHLCGTLGVPSQPHPSLGFTDTGQQGPSIAPDIHTVTLQLSKSQVEDILPPMISVTPKGSGAGYGVGFDLDDLFNQSLTELQHGDRDSYDSAPLSASLLSDWSEVHRMTVADLESLQQELQLGSPMILSDTIPHDA